MKTNTSKDLLEKQQWKSEEMSNYNISSFPPSRSTSETPHGNRENMQISLTKAWKWIQNLYHHYYPAPSTVC